MIKGSKQSPAAIEKMRKARIGQQYSLQYRKKIAIAGLGRIKSELKATEHPTSFDIVWAAGIWEGEGYCGADNKTGCERSSITQKDIWILKKLQKLFGGHISTKGHSNCYQWLIYGARARGFLMTIYKFMSPRRKEQIKQTLLKGKKLALAVN